MCAVYYSNHNRNNRKYTKTLKSPVLELPISNIFKLQKLWDVCLKQKIYAKIVNIRNGGNNSRGSLLIGML